ncbi:Ribosomal RNA small subunit methyltransferase D [Planctomycetes bacterium Pan216]|uniref:Ribosomal RNA small subunit methyltransferase D n=1 Tax=Kolteria novifilia TaxID=2527975 RepID=A0A518BAB1_9BACT|nr:Ribosomal RNA small subunit methyltransferase D [Planctomycetes bacterium Pan216]
MGDRLRITGGTRRGRKLYSPPSNTIRPASDFVRQAVFNMLGDWVNGCTFYDIFAGTGIVGMEALSRGAQRAIYIENDHRQISLIRRNLSRAGFGSEAQVRAVDALVWGKHFAADLEPMIVFIGPPYPLFARDLPGLWELVGNVQANLKPEDVLVLQFPRTIAPEDLPRAEDWYRVRKYGKTRIGIWVTGATGEEDLDAETDHDGSPDEERAPSTSEEHDPTIDEVDDATPEQD